MPNCFTLTRKSDIESGPVSLNQIDRELCEHFGAKCDDNVYYMSWFDFIGFDIARDKTFNEIKRDFANDAEEETTEEGKAAYNHLIELTQWLNDNFIANNWGKIGRQR